MMNDLTAHIAKTNGLADPIAKQALGIVLNAAERQASPFADAMFKTLPGAILGPAWAAPGANV